MTWSFPVASPLALERIDDLTELVGDRYKGWALDATGGLFVVDVLRPGVDVDVHREDRNCDRFEAETLEDAVRLAIAGEQQRTGAARA